MTGFKLFRAQNTFRLNLFITFVGFLDTFLIIPIIALYAVRLGATVGSVGLIIGLYSITNTPANIFFGRLIDRVGVRVPLIVGLLGDALAMVGYTLCRIPLHLMLVRAFHGVSGGVVGPATMSIAAEYSSSERRGRAMGYYGITLGVATLIGFALSGVLSFRLGYEFVFYVGTVMLLLGVGAAFLMPARKTVPYVSVTFSLRQELAKIIKLLKRKGLLAAYCSIFAQYFTFGGVVTLLPLYVKGLGMEAFHVGMLLATFAISFVLFQFPFGALVDRVGRQVPVSVGLFLVVVSLILLPTLGAFSLLAMVMVLYGASYGLIFPSISTLVADYTSIDERGRATGIFHALLTAGVAIGAPVMGWVGETVGLTSGLALSGTPAVLALLVVLVILRRR